MTWSSETSCARSRAGSTCTCSMLEPLAPDRDVGHAGHAQQARPDLPVRDHRHIDQATASSTVTPIFMTRLVVDSGGIMTGGAAQVGSVGDHRGQALLHQLPRLQQVGAAA